MALTFFLPALAWGQPSTSTNVAPVATPGAVERRMVAAAGSFNGEAFVYTIQLQHVNARHKIYAVTYPSPLRTELESNNTVPAEYYVPANLKADEPRRPAVICLHILNGNYELERMLCTFLAESGVPAIMFKLPYYGERNPGEGRKVLARDPFLFTACLKQAPLDVRRTVDVLAARPEVDAKRIGIAGISLGAIMAAGACGVEPRLQRAALLLGGGDLLRIVSDAREVRAIREALARLPPDQRRSLDAAIAQSDPLTHAAALRQLGQSKRLLMINASEDEVIPRACTLKLAEAAGIKEQVVWIEGAGHYTALAGLPRIMRDTIAFFCRDLPPGITAPPLPAQAKELPPMLALAAVLQQTASFLSQAPTTGHCHYISLQADITAPADKTTRYELTFLRGSNGRFKLTASPVPEVGTLAIGCGEYPWLKAQDGRLFIGRKEMKPAATVADFMEPPFLLRLQIIATAAVALAAVPDVFAEYVQVTDATAKPEERILAITLKHKSAKGTGQLQCRRDNLMPMTLTFDGGDVKGRVVIRSWALDAISSPELFREPDEARILEVPQQDLLRMFAAAFNFAMEKAQ
jgi:dienelactone hydrolase